MRKHATQRRKLEIEALEDRQLTATSLGSVMAFKPTLALNPADVKVLSATLLGSREIVDHTSWAAGLTRNHNETFVRTR